MYYQTFDNEIYGFVAAGPVGDLKDVLIEPDQIQIKWGPPSPLNSVVAYAVKVTQDGKCVQSFILDCDSCEVGCFCVSLLHHFSRHVCKDPC